MTKKGLLSAHIRLRYTKYHKRRPSVMELGTLYSY